MFRLFEFQLMCFGVRSPPLQLQRTSRNDHFRTITDPALHKNISDDNDFEERSAAGDCDAYARASLKLI